MDRTEGAKKIPGAGRARLTAINHHINWPPRRATQQAASKAISLWAPRSKGADKGILRSVRLEQTMNENGKLVKKKFDQAFSAAFRPDRRGGNEGAGLVLSGRALAFATAFSGPLAGLYLGRDAGRAGTQAAQRSALNFKQHAS
jgi:hypothetical protein